MNLSRLAGALTGLSLSTLFLLGATAAPASAAAPGCTGNSCTGKNPHTQRCDRDAKTIAIAHNPEGPSAYLRYSAACTAAWVISDKGDGAWRFKLDIKRSKPYVEQASPHYNAYTAMVSAHKAYRACYEAHTGRPNDWECTSWH
ncbi:DUF2690 domain-containing protein [Streptomyces sp. NPDC059835]|uniref:DUF2690 domain-containing protein n=1 Tax=Streptomyces sp. NPDC059835 TaxID=3346967 RepID=UPI0036646E76